MEGYIKLYRQLIESQIFANQTALKIWIWCLLKANHKERFIPLKVGKGNITIKILPGQFIFGRLKAEEELNIDGSTIYRWIQKLESKSFGMITIEANNQYSIISICNWSTYQSEKEEGEQPKSSQRTRHEPDMNTDKNVNNVKNEKNNTAVIFEAFRVEYPGNKGGLKIELDNFTKKNNPEIVTLLLPALEKEKQYRIKCGNQKEFVPSWKNLKTWINGKCWEQEFATTANNQPQQSQKTPAEWL